MCEVPNAMNRIEEPEPQTCEGQMSSLLPCPFCGCVPKFEYIAGFEKPYFFACKSEDCPASLESIGKDKMELAREVWNTRQR